MLADALTVANSANAIHRDSAPPRQYRQALRMNPHVSFLRVRAHFHLLLLPRRRLTWQHSARPSLRHRLIQPGRSPLLSHSMTRRTLLPGLRTSSRTSQHPLRPTQSKRQPPPKHMPPENIWAILRYLMVRHSFRYFSQNALERPRPTVLQPQLPMRTMPQMTTFAPPTQTKSPTFRSSSQMDSKSPFCLGFLYPCILTAVQVNSWKTRSNH